MSEIEDSEYRWPIVPLSKGQLLDVRPEDILKGGHFRKCLTYRGGGGYDKFPEICERRTGKRYAKQFIAQLRGCNLDCPYCYVTRAGVWGESVTYLTGALVACFLTTHQEVFHLMGGAPALYLKHWHEIISTLGRWSPQSIFHSDLMLTESDYKEEWLAPLSKPNVLVAVDIKGLTQEEHLKNTRKPFLEARFWSNLANLHDSGANYYITFTSIAQQNIDNFWKACPDRVRAAQEADAFSIDLIEYDALPHVDDVPWGHAQSAAKLP